MSAHHSDATNCFLLIQVRSCAGTETSTQLFRQAAGAGKCSMLASDVCWHREFMPAACQVPASSGWWALNTMHSAHQQELVSSNPTPVPCLPPCTQATLPHLHPWVPLPRCLRLLDDGVRALPLAGVYWHPCCCCQLEEGLLPHVGLGVWLPAARKGRHTGQRQQDKLKWQTCTGQLPIRQPSRAAHTGAAAVTSSERATTMYNRCTSHSTHSPIGLADTQPTALVVG
jgi:hypothetical protein